MDLDGGFAIPTKAGSGGEVAFKDRAGVGVVALGAAHVCKGVVEVLEFFLDEVVVVVIPRVAGDAVVAAGLFFCGEVVEGERDDRAAAGEDLARVAAAFDITLEPAHVAGVACFDPFEVAIGVGGTGGGGDATVIEAQLSSDELDVGVGDGGSHSWVPKW